jgi:hypothetical protein
LVPDASIASCTAGSGKHQSVANRRGLSDITNTFDHDHDNYNYDNQERI